MDAATLVRAMPGLSQATAAAYLPHMEEAMRTYGITTQARAAMWLAQVGHESGSLRYMEEIASGAAYEGRKDLGNTQPGDGRRFKGRGPIQITGRYNYQKASEALGLDLVRDPTLAARPQAAFRISAWWWQAHGLNDISDRGDLLAATRRINGGTRGLQDRQHRFRLAQQLGDAVIPGPPGPAQPPQPAAQFPAMRADYISRTHNHTHPDVQVWQAKMSARGWAITVDGDYGPRSEAVCRQFQIEKGLAGDGIIGQQTWRETWTSPVT